MVLSQFVRGVSPADKHKPFSRMWPGIVRPLPACRALGVAVAAFVSESELRFAALFIFMCPFTLTAA